MDNLVRWSGIDALKRRKREAVVKEWAKHRPLQRFLADHFPGEWANIQRCRTYWRPKKSLRWDGYYKAVPIYACRQLPFCIWCVEGERRRRVHEAFNKFQMCTPKGKQPQFIHIVQTAPMVAPHGRNPAQARSVEDWGWGLAASKDVRGFRDIVLRTLKEFYGDGIGAVMSYQDFGEQGFAKRHPHLDLTLNGWAVQDGAPALVKYLDLTGQGRAAWDDSIVRGATRFQITAKRGDVNVERRIYGVGSYYRVLSYQMRELVDLRKVEYSRDAQAVWWQSYKDSTRTQFTVLDFKARLAEYQWRLGQWGHESDVQQELHVGMGHLSKNMVRKTMNKMGGEEPKHKGRCLCSECSDWENVTPQDVAREEERMRFLGTSDMAADALAA